MRHFDRGFMRIISVMAVISAAVLMTIMLTMSFEVFSRLTRNESVSGLYELTQALVAVAVFLAITKAERVGAHVRVELVTSRLPKRLAEPARRIGDTATVAIVGLLAFATAQRAMISVDVGEVTQGYVAFPIWPARMIIAIGLTVLAVEYALRAFRGRSNEVAHTAGEHA